MFMLSLYFVYDVALCRNTVRNWLLVSEWLVTPGLAEQIIANCLSQGHSNSVKRVFRPLLP